jgi:hypothetical protein
MWRVNLANCSCLGAVPTLTEAKIPAMNSTPRNDGIYKLDWAAAYTVALRVEGLH